MSLVVATFYHFVQLPDYRRLKSPLLQLCEAQHLRGTILLAGEGINATVAGTREGIDALCSLLKDDMRFVGMEYKESVADEMPFHRMKVRLKKEIVTMGRPETRAERRSGIHVGPDEWNALLDDPGVTVIDTRNQYECDIGKFKNAVSPHTNTFGEFPDYVAKNLDPARDKKIAMYCTGGIRCEKASAYLLEQGFSEVYQLNGGILRYLAEVAPEQNAWQGECFVFDGRVAVDDDLRPGEHTMCYSCRRPLSTADRASDKYREGISCPACHDSLTPERRANLEQRWRQVLLAEQRQQKHIGVPFVPKRKNA